VSATPPTPDAAPPAATVDYAIVATDPDGVVTLVSAEAERLVGWGPEDVVGRSTVDSLLCTDELAARASQLGLPPGPEVLLAPARNDHYHDEPWTFVGEDGRCFPVLLTTMVMRGKASAVLGYLLVARHTGRQLEIDESMHRVRELESHMAARVRELDRVRSELASTVSHELRTPLTTILGVLEMLIDGDAGPLEPAQTGLLANLERSSRRLLAMIEDLLLMSRLEPDGITVSARSISIQSIVDEALQILPPGRADSGPDLHIALPTGSPLVFGDREQLRRVVLHLVDNALKFTPADGFVRIGAKQTGGYVELTVRDNGIGISGPDLAHVFDPFFRSSSAQEREIQGSGLGLTISRWIVERHGGQISIDSTPNAGTIVVCLIPQPPREP
jgi:PAS domain S-box-containing protein